ncbi:MAG: hypothetical protein E6K54_07675 [Gammaproteobacteria bacterium]|nr:MAG: hypothetical protein E6K54_07675 [Gammaproteobacteria bacterium]
MNLCEVCGLFFNSDLESEHLTSAHHNMCFVNAFVEIESAAECRLVTLLAKNPNEIHTAEEYMESLRQNVCYYLSHYLTVHACVKYNLVLECYYYKSTDDNAQLKNFKTPNVPVFRLSNLNDQYSADIVKILSEMDEIETRGSGWVLAKISHLQLRINRYEPLRGATAYRRFQLPRFIKNKRCLVNPYRYDPAKEALGSCCATMCFKFSILGQVLRDNNINVHNITNYFKHKRLNDKYVWDCVQYPVALDDIQKFETINNMTISVYTADETARTIVPLKVSTNRSESDHRDILYYEGHYSWIKNFNILVSGQVIRRSGRCKHFFCRTCFQHFYQSALLTAHEKSCRNYKPTIVVPSKDTFLQFKNFNRSLKIPFVIYADIGYKLTPIPTCSPDPKTTYTHTSGIYRPTRCSYRVVSTTGQWREKQFDNIPSFVRSLELETMYIRSIYKQNVPMDNVPAGKPLLGVDICHICETQLKDIHYALDHDHVTGKVRGFVHRTCNLNYRLPRFVPIVVRDLSKINSAPLMEHFLKTGGVRVIPYKEKVGQFISLTRRIGEDGFSMRFVDMSKFIEPGDDYQLTVAKFERIRHICVERLKLDPLYYLSLGSYSWDCMLRYTGVQLQVIRDVDMLLMLKSGIRGGFVSCVRKHALANVNGIDPSKPPTSIHFFDVIGLYSSVMKDRLMPYGGFEWAHDFHVSDIFSHHEPGVNYIVEVDINYPENVRRDHSDLPLCPHHDEQLGLIASFRPREKYVVHLDVVRYAISKGLEVTRVHRAIKFKESNWLVGYVELNGTLRNENPQFSGFFKDLNNFLYGKSIERLGNRVNVRILRSDPRTLMKLVRLPTFYDRTILNSETYIVMNRRQRIKVTQPIYLGMAILDLSKLFMSHLFYDVLKPRLPRFELLYTDTDSLCIEVFTNNADEVIKEMGDVFHHDKSTAGPIGKLKNLTADSPILEFVGFRSKVYAYRCSENMVMKNIPPTAKFVFHDGFPYDDLKFNKHFRRTMGTSVYDLSVNRTIPTVAKTSDRKRILCSDNNHTLPLV